MIIITMRKDIPVVSTMKRDIPAVTAVEAAAEADVVHTARCIGQNVGKEMPYTLQRNFQ